MEKIVVGKDGLIVFRDREAFKRIWGLFLRIPMNIVPTDENGNWVVINF
jgi:hypothetical protein